MFSKILLGEVCVKPIHFNKYEFFVEFETDCDTLIVEPKDGLRIANLLGKVLHWSGERAYDELKPLGLNWPVDSQGEWAEILSFSMYYYDFKGNKRHVTLK